MTRQTKLYKISAMVNKTKQNIFYRDLTANEYTFINNIKNLAIKEDIAGRTAIYNYDPDKLSLGVRIQIGRDALSRVDNILSSKQIFEITISEFRASIKSDDFMLLIKQILSCLPGQSYIDLLNLTLKDLIELACLCELLIGKPLFDSGKKGGLVNPKNLEDNGKSLQDKMNKLHGVTK
ncbi:MAG: hypothetical protein M0R17_05530 [Candidatus Omnitrophica bacterium]|jgi:hypothetical protein|nr:hypothetical protein [Candidatus Omnitrophota bacterium]